MSNITEKESALTIKARKNIAHSAEFLAENFHLGSGAICPSLIVFKILSLVVVIPVVEIHYWAGAIYYALLNQFFSFFFELFLGPIDQGCHSSHRFFQNIRNFLIIFFFQKLQHQYL